MINFTSDSSQTFTTSINGEIVEFNLNYNTTADIWMLDIITQTKAVYGVRLIGGHNILEQYNLGFGLISSQDDPLRDDIEYFTLEAI